jgi:hypothetical protein
MLMPLWSHACRSSMSSLCCNSIFPIVELKKAWQGVFPSTSRFPRSAPFVIKARLISKFFALVRAIWSGVLYKRFSHHYSSSTSYISTMRQSTHRPSQSLAFGSAPSWRRRLTRSRHWVSEAIYSNIRYLYIIEEDRVQITHMQQSKSVWHCVARRPISRS